ncbi:MAG: polyprenyl synthetase family protein [Oscillospiraceae bacterium]|nr:polyprenyl synthetase family protein [Oscillospiraceae bacterium]
MDNNIKSTMNMYARAVEDNLKKYTQANMEDLPQKTLLDAMKYSLEAPGKRIRPVLVYEFCRVCGGKQEDAAAAACAIEMLHTFSLIHDDLPAMDDDDFRRGRPSCHKAFTQAAAVLAGDELAILPFQIIAQDERLSSDKKVALIADLSSSAGIYGMIGGQMIDVENETRTDIDVDNLTYMCSLKTGALISTSCVMGCICAGADKKKADLARQYAGKLGLAFQIVDDILDVTSTTEELGKPVGSDEEQNKTTFVTLLGIEKARHMADRLTSEALEILNNFDNNEFLIKLTNELLTRRY